jgi:hypothetical protein
MRKLTFAALLGVALISAAACSGCQSGPFSNVVSDDKGVLTETLNDEKALYAVEAAFYGANSAAEAAVDTGLLKPGSPDAVKVADYLAQGHTALLAARAAYRAGDAKTYTQKLASVQAFVASAWALIPGKKEA